MKAKLKINTSIGCYRMQFTIDREEEEIFRKAEKQVNSFITEYQKLFPNKSGEEIFSIVAFRLAVVVFKMEFNQDDSFLVDRIKNLDDEIDKLLSESATYI